MGAADCATTRAAEEDNLGRVHAKARQSRNPARGDAYSVRVRAMWSAVCAVALGPLKLTEVLEHTALNRTFSVWTQGPLGETPEGCQATRPEGTCTRAVYARLFLTLMQSRSCSSVCRQCTRGSGRHCY